MHIVAWSGFGGVPEDFAGLRENLARFLPNLHWHIPWLPGHGPQPQPVPVGGLDSLVQVLLADLPPGAPPLLLGYSLGGRLALTAALAQPERFRGLILLSTSPGWPETTPQAERHMRLAQDEAWAQELAQTSTPATRSAFFAKWWSQPVFHSPRWQFAFYQRFLPSRSLHQPQPLAAVLRQSSVALQPSWWNHLPRLGLPTLILAGAADTKFANIAQKMANRLPHSECYLLPEAGHALLLENPPALAEIIHLWINRQIWPT